MKILLLFMVYFLVRGTISLGGKFEPIEIDASIMM